jgi:ribosome-binding protein aMBF1 (putative translation factor)
MIIPNAENGSEYTICKGVRPQTCPICGRQETKGSISVVLNDWGCNASVCKSCWDSGFKKAYTKAGSLNSHNPTIEQLTERKEFHARERKSFMEQANVNYRNYLKTLRNRA